MAALPGVPRPLAPAWPDGGPRLFCRTHGEPLRFDWQRDAYVCPSLHVCGTWVGDEAVAGMVAAGAAPVGAVKWLR